MIVELGRISRARLRALADRLDREGRAIAWLEGEGWGGVRLAADPVEEIRIAPGPLAMDDVARALDAVAQGHDAGFCGRAAAFRWIGTLAYEAARGLERQGWTPVDGRPSATGGALLLRRYAAVARLDDDGLCAVEGDDASSCRRLAELIVTQDERTLDAVHLSLQPIDDDATHERRVRRVIELIGQGDVYVVNVSRVYEARTEAHITSLLRAMQARASARYGAAIDFGDHAVACTSPELFLDVNTQGPRGRRVLTSPIKGTRPRGVDHPDDARLREALRVDPKERAELTMVVDLERNDLGRVAETGTVRVVGAPRIETSRTVHHLVQDVVAEVPRERGLGEIVRATFPSGSVTGAPKVRAMEVIAELEARRRGIYCGALLTVGRDGAARAAMAIRTLVVDRLTGLARYDAGGGIVADSDPAREVAESHWKARQVVPS